MTIDIKKKNYSLKNKNKIDKLQFKLDRIEESLKCPISKGIIDESVVTFIGVTYEKNKIIRWLISNNIDPISKKKFPQNN